MKSNLFKVSAFLIIISVFFYSCKKSPATQNQQAFEQGINPSLNKPTDILRPNPSVTLAVVKNIDVPINFNVAKPLTNNPTASCSDHATDISLTYIGFIDQGSCSGPRYITLRWLLKYPANTQGCENSGFYPLPFIGIAPAPGTNSFATFNSPFLSAPKTAQIGIASPHYDEDYMIPQPTPCSMTVEVYANFTLTEQEYAAVNQFDFNVQIESDCSAFPLIQPVSSMSDYLTQNTYNPYPYPIISNSSSGGVHKFTVLPVVSLCLPAHPPLLGNSPYHKIRYRLMYGNDWWNSSYTTYGNTTTAYDVVVPSAGTYEFIYRYQQSTDGTLSEYTQLLPVVVN